MQVVESTVGVAGDNFNVGGVAASDSKHRLSHTAQRPLAQPPTMSLPRSDYDPRRVCLIPFPTVALAQNKRTVGVYVAGALVRFQPPMILLVRIAILNLLHYIVRPRKLAFLGCSHPVLSCQTAGGFTV